MRPNVVYWVVAEVSPQNAGYRIRAARLARALAAHAIDVRIIPLSEFAKSLELIAAEASAVVVAKPVDTSTILCMKHLVRNGVRVIADIFDNYFSWSPSLYRQAFPWRWLRAIDSETCAGAIASTPILADVMAGLGVRDICVVSDLLPDETLQRAPDASTLSDKWRAPDQIEALWFGISSNPHFHAGLEDLISWARIVAGVRDRLAGHRRFRLTICTKSVPAVQGALRYFYRESIETRFVPWTVEVCDQLLADSHVVLIPTNLNDFSLSKTHNRCSDAIWKQCLVLASRGGPYLDIGGAVYLNVDELCDDLCVLDASVIARRFAASVSRITTAYEDSRQAARLAEFLLRKEDPAGGNRNLPETDVPRVLLTGQGAQSDTIKLSRTFGYLTASFKGSRINMNFDYLLTAIDHLNEKVTFEVSERGKLALGSIYIKNAEGLDADWESCSPGYDRHLLTLGLPGTGQLLAALETALAVSETQPLLIDRIFELAVQVIIPALRALGLDHFEYCTEGSGGWEHFIQLGAPHLQASSAELHQYWQQGEQWRNTARQSMIPDRVVVAG